MDSPICEHSHGQKCETKAELEKLKKELQLTRDYIHDRNLEWDLLSYTERRKQHEQLQTR